MKKIIVGLPSRAQMGINHVLMDWVNQVEISAQRKRNRDRTDFNFLLSPNNLVALRLEVINLNEGKLCHYFRAPP